MRGPMVVPQIVPSPSRTAPEVLPRWKWVPGWVRDLIDRWRHPGESVAMRRYRRWKDATGRGDPAVYVRPVSGPSRLLLPGRKDMAAPIVGVTFERTSIE